MKNIFTVDLEDWYHANYHGNPIDEKISRIEQPTLKILNLLNKTKNKATFFVLGVIAQKYPELVKEIHRQGHEIASHSFNHNLVYSQTQKEFLDDTKKSIDIIENIIKNKIIGFRAPSWSVDKIRTPWYWDSLKLLGLKYSSSLFPYKTFLYGDSTANKYFSEINGINEIPPSVITTKFGYRIPFSGGFYLRFFPIVLINIASKYTNKQNQPTIFYIHPREIDPLQPKINNLTHLEKFIHYYNISNTLNKLEYLFKNLTTTSIKEFYF